jgi:hypothetical protein
METIKHGLTDHPLYIRWSCMKGRCYNSNNKSYSDYGSRNIKVCDEWRNDFKSFYRWAINSGWNPKLTIDRINNEGDYEPSNCRWTDRKIQNNNTRRNRYLEFNGVTKTMSEWAEITGIKVKTIFMRLTAYGWSVEKTLSTI